MALVNAYVRCGRFEKAKQVVSDKSIPAANLNEIRSVLIQALATNGRLSDALSMHAQSCYGSYFTELDYPHYWIDGCFRVVLYCVRYKHLSTAVALLKQLKDKLCTKDEFVIETLLDEVFSQIGNSGPAHLQIGLNFLNIVKNDLGLSPPRRSLDFLLHACVNAKDLDGARLVWDEG